MTQPSPSYERFSFGDHIPIILASDIDENEIERLTSKLSSCCEYLFGGRAAISYSKEVKLFSSLLYHILSFDQDNCTLGQDFNGLKLIQSQFSNKNNKKRAPPLQKITSGFSESILDFESLLKYVRAFRDFFSRSGQIIYSPLKREEGNTARLALALSILPYLLSRRTDISSVLFESYNAFTAEEQDPVLAAATARSTSVMTSTTATVIRTPPEPMGPTSSLLSADSLHYNTTDINGINSSSDSSIRNYSDNTDNRTPSATSFPSAHASTRSSTATSQLFSAIKRTFMSSGSSSTLRSQGLMTWIEALHLYSFLVNGSFYSLALRLCGVRFRKSLSSSGGLGDGKDGRVVPQSKMNMGSLAFLLTLQLSIMTVHTAAVLAAELIKGDGGRSTSNLVNESGGTERRGESSSGRDDNRVGIEGIGNTTGNVNDSTVTSHTSRQGQSGREVQLTEETGIQEDKTKEKVKERGEELDLNKKQCPLCMDFVGNPAATPCGHVYCWTCIHKWVISDRNDNGNTHTRANMRGSSSNRNVRNNNSNDSNSDNPENGIKCPVCRQLFQQHQIRALFCYS